MTTWTELVKYEVGPGSNETITNDLKTKVMEYHAGCGAGKRDFLKYLGYDFPLEGRWYGGKLTVTIDVEYDDWVNVDNIRAAIANVLIADSTRTEGNDVGNPQFKIETTSDRNYE